MKKSNLATILLAVTFGAIGIVMLATKLSAGDVAASSCCGGSPEAVAVSASEFTSNHPALAEPVKSVYDHYLAIQTGLAKDSLTGLTENAGAIVKAAQNDNLEILPKAIATQAETLAKASDLKAARIAFKPLSDSLIKYLADHQAKGAYVEVYCPMARASWLQTNKIVSNPYFGQAMSSCGEVQN